MALSDTTIRSAKPAAKRQRLTDGGGLYLEISPAGGKLWRFKYRYGGKEKRLALGAYPDVCAKDAREKRDIARKQLASGIDPGEHRKSVRREAAERTANTFEAVAREWFEKQEQVWAASHSSKILLRLNSYLFPWIGARPVSEVSAKELLACLRRIEARGAIESAHRTLQNCGQILRYAIATGRAQRNVAADLRGALAPVKATHRAAILEPEAIGGLLRSLDDYRGSAITRAALKLAPLLFVRPGELRNMEWREIDLAKAQWNLAAEKMKSREPHLVPLSRQAVEILTELRPLTGNGKYVFPSARSHLRPMSNNAVLAALRRMGYAKEEMSGHGFRAMARTVLDEILHVRPDFIEHQMAHAVRDPNGRAYNRTAHLAERRAMMAQWADYLDVLRNGGNVIPLKKTA